MNKSLKESFLQYIFGIFLISRDSAGRAEDHLLVPIAGFNEGPTLSCLRCRDQRLIIRLIEGGLVLKSAKLRVFIGSPS
jgi:hypothetical protein